MKKQYRKYFTIVLAFIILFSNFSSISFADKDGDKVTSPISGSNTGTSLSTIKNTDNDFIVEADQSTILGDMNNAYIDVKVTPNFTNYVYKEITNLVAYAQIDNPQTVHIGDNGVYQMGNVVNGDTFRIPLFTTETNEDVTVPIKITLKYDVLLDQLSTESKSTTEFHITPAEEDLPLNTTETNSYSVNTSTESREFTTTIYVLHKAEKIAKNSMIEIKSMKILPNEFGLPGQNLEVFFQVYNPGDAPANNIKLQLEGLEANGINMASGLSTQDITKLEPKEGKVAVFNLKVPASAKGGLYPLNLKYTFNGKNSRGEDTAAPIEGVYNFSIDVKQADLAPSTIIFDKINFPKGRLGKNQNVGVSFSIKNIGKNKAQNIKISAISQDVEGLTPTTASTAIVPSLAPNEVASYSFGFKTTNSVGTKAYPVEIAIEYIDDGVSEEPHKITQMFSVNGVDWEAEALKNKDLPKSTPILIIEKYDFEPQMIFAGTQFDINLDIKNTSSKQTIRNIKIALSSDIAQSANSENGAAPPPTASVFTPVQSSNTFFIDSIPPGGKVEKTITMTTSHDTAAKTYTLTANLNYEDGQANPFESQEIIGINIIQDSKFSIGEVILDPEFYIMQPGNLNVEFYNTGKVTLSNFMVELEGEGLNPDTPTYYKGNFPSGTSDSFSCNISPESLENNKGKLIFTYEDTTGESHKIEKDFTINVMEMEDFGMEDDMYPMEEEPKGLLGGKLPFIIGGFIALLAGGGFLVYRKRKKKKEEEDLFLDED